MANDAGADGSRWEILRPSFPHQGTRRHEISEGSGDVLIGNVDLLFERVQLGIAENLPPLAMESAILRLRDFPAVHLLEIVRSDFFISPRRLHRGAIVFRTDNTALQEEEECDREQRGRSAHFVRCPHRGLGLLASLASAVSNPFARI